MWIYIAHNVKLTSNVLLQWLPRWNHHHRHFWQAPLRVRFAERRHQSPERTVLSHDESTIKTGIFINIISNQQSQATEHGHSYLCICYEVWRRWRRRTWWHTSRRWRDAENPDLCPGTGAYTAQNETTTAALRPRDVCHNPHLRTRLDLEQQEMGIPYSQRLLMHLAIQQQQTCAITRSSAHAWTYNSAVQTSRKTSA